MSRWLEKQEQLAAENINVSVLPVLPKSAPHKYKAGDYYTWLKGDSLVDVARAMNVEVKTLMEFNEIESYGELETGTMLAYPFAAPSTIRRIRVELKDERMYMHVGKAGGAKKWMFGSMNTWDDALPAGYYPEGTNLEIVAVAYVPIADPDNPNAEAAYYLENYALGEFRESGILRYTIGFAWSDLESGHAETALKKAEPAPPKVPLHEVIDIEDDPVLDEQIPVEAVNPYILEIMNSYKELDEPIECIGHITIETEGSELDFQTARRFIYVKDYAHKKLDRPFYHNQDETIGATFTSDGIVMGRPVDAIEANNFYAIPMHLLKSQDEIYNEPVDATTRAENGGSLTWSERYLWVPVTSWLARYVPGFLQKINKDKENK